MRQTLLTTYLLILFHLTFGQTYNQSLTDKETENFISWDVKNWKDEPDVFYGLEDNQISFFTSSIDWKDLLTVFEPDHETEFDGLFKDLFADSIFKNVDKEFIRRQYAESKKNLTFDFIKRLEGVTWTDTRKMYQPTINYTSPIVTKDKKILIMCKDFSLNNGNEKIRGEYHINVYYRQFDNWTFYKSWGATY